MALQEPSFSDGGMRDVGFIFVWGQNFFRLGDQKTMNEIGADIPVSLWNCLSISSVVMKLEGLFNQLLLY